MEKSPKSCKKRKQEPAENEVPKGVEAKRLQRKENKLRKLTAHLMLMQSAEIIVEDLKDTCKKLSKSKCGEKFAFIARKVELEKQLIQVKNTLKEWPGVKLQHNGITARLATPEGQRTPVLVSDVGGLLQAVCLPSFRSTVNNEWFSYKKKASQVFVIIVEGVSLDTFSGLGLSRNKVKIYHQRMLEAGKVKEYCGDYTNEEGDGQSTSGQIINSKKRSRSESRLDVEPDDGRPSKKRKTSDRTRSEENDEADANINLHDDSNNITINHSSNNIRDIVHTWLPQTSSLLNLSLEMVTPSIYQSSVADTLLQIRCPRLRLRNIQLGMSKTPKTIEKRLSEEVLYRNTGKMKSVPIIPSTSEETILSATPTEESQVELPHLEIERHFSITANAEDHVSDKHWKISDSNKQNKILKSDKFDRRSLLISFSMLYEEHYPMPEDVFITHADEYFKPSRKYPTTEDINYLNFVSTKGQYGKVTASSPMFGLDCEFVYLKDNCPTLGSISIVAESGELVYHTLVKPPGQVMNYATQWSGLTEAMLDTATATLQDVQHHIREHLPPDAILVGHSLSTDLKIMQMHHPYVMDTSLLYNMTGNRVNRSKLKTLSFHFLKRNIQMRKRLGHDPTEDAEATLELVQLKLQHDLKYGNIILGGRMPVVTESRTTEEPREKEDYYYNMFEYLEDWRQEGALLLSLQPKMKQLFVTTPEHSSKWRDSVAGLPRAIVPEVLQDNEQVIQKVTQTSLLNDFTIAHLQGDPRLQFHEGAKVKPRLAALAELDDHLAQVYKAAADKALVCVMFTGTTNSTGDIDTHSNGIFMCGIKGKELIVEERKNTENKTVV